MCVCVCVCVCVFVYTCVFEHLCVVCVCFKYSLRLHFVTVELSFTGNLEILKMLYSKAKKYLYQVAADGQCTTIINVVRLPV